MATSPLRGTQFTNTVQPTQAELDLVTGRHGEFRRGAEAALYGLSAGSYANEAMSAEYANDAARKESALRRAVELSERAAYEAPNQDIREIGGVGDAIDFAQGAMGNAAVTMAPSIAAALLTRGRSGLAGKAAAFGGAMVPAYQMERNEALLSQYQDPEQMKASLADRDMAASGKGVINAALESFVPASLGHSLLRKPAGSFLGNVGREAVTEGLTEGAQQVVGFGAQKYLDPNKQLDPWDVANAVAAGAAGGGGMAAATGGPAHAAAAVLGRRGSAKKQEVVPAPDSAPDTVLDKAMNLGQVVGERVSDKTKDIVSSTLDRMAEAVNTSTGPGDFLGKVFGGNIEDEAAADMSDAPNPALKGATFEETEANIARDDEQRADRAMRYADELLNDPATPAETKQRVADMGGDYTDPTNQSFVSRTLATQRSSEKITNTVQGLIKLGKGALTKGVEAVSDRIVKKNLQSASPAEQAAFNKVVFDGLTDEAKANPEVRRQLSEVTNAMMAFAAKTGDVTAKDLPTLTKLSDAMSLFKDPDVMAQTLVEYAGLPRTEDSFLSRIKRVTNAQQDLKQANSFLYASMTPEARERVTTPQLQRIAQLVDQFALIDGADSKKGEALIRGLANAFGSPENAKAVLDYYAQQNKADIRFDVDEDPGSLSEQDAKELVPRFRSPNVNRPFLRGRDDTASAAELARGGDLAQRVSLAEHVRSSDKLGKIVIGDIRRDLMKRLDENLGRDTESVRNALSTIENHLESSPTDKDAVALRDKLRSTKTEDRSTIVKALRDELKALDSASESAKRSGKNADEAMLGLYDVVMSSKDESKASDEQMTKFRKLLDTTSQTKKTDSQNADIRKTGVTFKIDGKKVAVSLESMVYHSPVRGSVRERLLESVGLVAARADEAPTIPDDTIVKRNYFGDGKHLTWGRLMGLGTTPKMRTKHTKHTTTPAEEKFKAKIDSVNASNLRQYMDSLPKDVDALSTGAELLGKLERQLEATKKKMDASPDAELGTQIRALSSKQRVLKTYINELLDADYPVSREAIMENLESELEANGVVEEDGKSTEYANILFTEELIQTYRDRAEALKGTSLADDALSKAEELTLDLDSALSKLQDFQRIDEMDRPSSRGKGNSPKTESKARTPEKDAESSRKNVSKINDIQALSPDAFTALHDVAVKENWKRLDTPAKVLSFAAMAAKAREQIAKLDAADLTATQAELKTKLEKIDWESLLKGLKPTDVQRAQLKELARPSGVEGEGFSAFHSSGHDHDGSFDWKKHLGSGEGRAAFGAGTYLSTDAGVNAAYRNAFDPNNITDSAKELIDDATDRAGAGASAAEIRKVAVAAAPVWSKSFFERLPDAAFIGGEPKTYEVSVSLNPKDMLDWNAPISDSEKAYAAIEKALITDERFSKPPKKSTYSFGDAPDSAVHDVRNTLDRVVNDGDSVTGGEVYRALEAFFGSDAKASLFLNSIGIHGSVHDSAATRRNGGGRNYVVFDDSKISTTSKYSSMKPKPGRPAKIDKQAILDEVARIRGKDVGVAFAKFAELGASGEFSMNPDKTQRLIKIATNSLNPVSVAWHESLHDFMAMLGGSKAERKLKADLLDAAEAPQVKVKLRELLEGHSKALKQIETDREERLAFMYQFWAEGALKLGPTGTNIFSRAATFFRQLLGVLSQDQKIDRLLDALHTGKFSEPSLVGTVIEKLRAKTLGDRVREISGPIGDLAEAMFTGTTDRLRNTNVAAFTELADLFHREPGRETGGELPFLQRRAQQVGKRLNKLQDILANTSADDRLSALENMQSMKPASSPLERELAAYLKEMRDYMVDRGVQRFDSKSKTWKNLGNVTDYFPRVWDKEAIRKNEAEFIALMEQHIGKEQARETYNALVNGDGSLELAENEHALGFTPWNPAVLDRQFTFITAHNAANFTKFQSKDMADIMTSYVQRAVHRAEYAKSFGNNGELITEKFIEAKNQGATGEELAMARKATMAMEGTLGYDFNPRLKEVMSGIATYQNIVLLPLSLFSSLIDPLGVAMRSGDMKEAWNTFKYGMKGIADQLRGAGPDAQTEMAKTLGLIDDQNMLEAMGHVYNSMHMSRFLKNVNSKFFRYNGMEMWNQRMRVSAMMAAQRFILTNLGNERYQSELGITDSDVFQLADDTIALTKDQLLQAGAPKAAVSGIEKRIQAAIFKWVDGAVLRPNAAHRPIWGSDPRYQLIFHLKQFTFSFHNTILRRVGEELKHGNVAPGWILMSYVPFMFLSDVLKGSLTGTINTTTDLYDVASRSIARSGILGTGVFGSDTMNDMERGRLPGASFLGPTFGHLSTLVSGVTGEASAGQLVDRSVPLAKYFD